MKKKLLPLAMLAGLAGTAEAIFYREHLLEDPYLTPREKSQHWKGRGKQRKRRIK